MAWLQATASHKRLNVVQTCLVSSKTGEGLSAAAAVILKERQGRDLYVLGAANVGKSAFVRCCQLSCPEPEALRFHEQPTAWSRQALAGRW